MVCRRCGVIRDKKIDYPGSGNNSQFVYDAMSRNVKIVETTSGSPTGTKQFVWSGDRMRHLKPCEERDGAGSLTKQFFGHGQSAGAAKYFYGMDKFKSLSAMTDSSGTIQAQYDYDPYGRVRKISELLAADFQYDGYYVHARSGINITPNRAYSATFGRWLNRDPIGESSDLNLYSYVENSPVNGTDPSGLQCILWFRLGPSVTATSALRTGTIDAGAGAGDPFPLSLPYHNKPDVFTIPDPGTKGNPNFECCKGAGNFKCCDSNRGKCEDMCDYWYEPEEGNYPDMDAYRSCLFCCKGKWGDCKRGLNPDFKSCSAQKGKKPLSPPDSC